MIPISRPLIGDAEKAAVVAVLESGMLAQGVRTAEFEECFAQMCGVKHAVAVSSGTTALQTALLACGVGPGDEVITTPFTFIATVNAILFVGATPVLVDIEPESFNINPDLIEDAITPRTKAILPVHLYGHMADMERIKAIADAHELVIVEDACQAAMAALHGRYAGSYGVGAFSLYGTKNLTCGEGGMITTDDDAIAAQCRMIRNHGMQRRYDHRMFGYNFRLTDIQAAIGLVQLTRLREFTEKRRANAEYLNRHLHTVRTPDVREGYGHVWHQYTVRVNGGLDRDAAVEALSEAGVGTGVYYPTPVHHQPYLQDLFAGQSLPVTEQMAREVMSLPVHPGLSQLDLEVIVDAVNSL